MAEKKLASHSFTRIKKDGRPPAPLPAGWRIVYLDGDDPAPMFDAVAALAELEEVTVERGAIKRVEPLGWGPVVLIDQGEGDFCLEVPATNAVAILAPGEEYDPPARPERLTRTLAGAESRVLEDAYAIALVNAEDGLLQAGAKPGVDYTWRDLVQLAAAVAPRVWGPPAAERMFTFGNPTASQVEADRRAAAAVEEQLTAEERKRIGQAFLAQLRGEAKSE